MTRIILRKSARLLNPMILIAVFAGLSGCAGKIRYPSYYVLDLTSPPRADAKTRPILGAVSVREFNAPTYLRSGPIVYRPSPGQLDFYNYHRWALDPRSAITSAVIREIEARGLFQSVSLLDGRANLDYLLTGTLDRLEEVDRDSDVFIEVTLSAQLTDLRSGEVVWRDVSSKSARLDDHSMRGIVAEMSRAVDDAVTYLATSLRNHVVPASASRGGTN
jgi:ABC-type uncharacterized transport system auxiliary subunit